MPSCPTPLVLAVACAVAAQEAPIVVPEIPGLQVAAGETVLIQPDSVYAAVFRFADGRIAVGGVRPAKVHEDATPFSRTTGLWSTDGGHTWTEKLPGPNNAALELGDGRVLALGFGTKKRPDGKYTLAQKRSLDSWQTVADEESVVDTPRSVPCGGDDGATNSGFLMDHGLIRLKNGQLMATMYGNYEGDTATCADWPARFSFRFYRTIVVFSADEGKTWGNPVTVAYISDPGKVQEGLDEGGLARAANGDILCVMRSGGSFGKYTPLYQSRSTNEGQTWSEPVAIADRGTWPNLCVMQSGVIVCTYSRPDNWLIFSMDDGRTWRGAFAFAPGSSYNSVVEVAPDTLLVVWSRPGGGSYETVGTFFKVKRK
jgi:hypothetical protein